MKFEMIFEISHFGTSMNKSNFGASGYPIKLNHGTLKNLIRSFDFNPHLSKLVMLPKRIETLTFGFNRKTGISLK